jgi:hypothetical protein
MGDVIAWVSVIAAVVVAITGIALWLSERENSKTLRRQQATLEQQLAEAREAREQSKPVDLRILELTAAGGGGDYVDFNLSLANYRSRQSRCNVIAHVAGEALRCHPAVLDLIPSTPPSLVRVLVPRAQLGELVSECNNETLYGETLVVRVVEGDSAFEETWRETVYDPEIDRERHAIQQRYWRRGRGEETEADMRVEHLAERIRRRDEETEPPDLYDV